MPLNKWYADIEWSDWLRGLFAGAISAGSDAAYAGIGTNFLAPETFNAHTRKFYALLGGLFLWSAVKSTLLYLKQKPLPERKRTVTLEITETPAPPEKKD